MALAESINQSSVREGQKLLTKGSEVTILQPFDALHCTALTQRSRNTDGQERNTFVSTPNRFVFLADDFSSSMDSLFLGFLRYFFCCRSR